MENIIRNDIEELLQKRECKIIPNFEKRFNLLEIREQNTLKIAFINLLDNATKYSNPGGEVFIRLKSLGPETALVEIENRGQGIPADSIERVRQSRERWEPQNLLPQLEQRRKGEGLGLSMAIEYVENHGGWLDISSHPEDNKNRDDASNNWITIVTVALPIVK